jgi:hypothetical protein
MTPSRPFGRRTPVAAPSQLERRAVSPMPAAPSEEAAIPSVEPAGAVSAPALDEELRAWQRERLKGLPARLPLRQLSLMASLSFGVASFVLPDSINDDASWFLYILTGASAIAWLSTWKRKSKATE